MNIGARVRLVDMDGYAPSMKQGLFVGSTGTVIPTPSHVAGTDFVRVRLDGDQSPGGDGGWPFNPEALELVKEEDDVPF